MIKLTYLIPVFNASKTLLMTYQSLKEQTYSNFKIVFIDDGSSDNSLDLLEEIEKSDNRVTIIRKKHQGLVKTLNLGLLNIKSDWIIRLDSDDIAYPSRTEYIVRAIKRSPANTALITSDFAVFNEKVNSLRIKKINPYFAKYYLLSGNNPFTHSSISINKNLIGNKILYREKFKHAEDYDMWLRLLSKYNYVHISKPLIKYRIHDGQITQRFKTISIENKYLALKEHYKNYYAKGSLYLLKKFFLILISINKKIELIIFKKQSSKKNTLAGNMRILKILLKMLLKMLLKIIYLILIILNLSNKVNFLGKH